MDKSLFAFMILCGQVVFLGMMLSSTFWGFLSDRFGRKQVLEMFPQIPTIEFC